MGLILVIDDHTDTRKVVQKLLGRWGHQTLDVDTAEAALALLATEKPTLIIVDGMMPGMNGIEFIRLVRANLETATIPIILYTAVSDQTFLDNAIEKGANEIWIKGRTDTEQIQMRVEHYH
jgi:CheY-like chemotaxis protein